MSDMKLSLTDEWNRLNTQTSRTDAVSQLLFYAGASLMLAFVKQVNEADLTSDQRTEYVQGWLDEIDTFMKG